ncbi:hypothetical protein P280DRAFT_467942, partial [Massarina eburnea CBS 473.64]
MRRDRDRDHAHAHANQPTMDRPDMDDDQPKRKRTFRQDVARKKTKNDEAPSGSFSGFGAKMMAKMGYRSGEGLGKDGGGIRTNIEVKLRDRGVGIGAGGSEKTKQQKEEERRRKEEAGDKYEDSSEEEKKRRKKKKGTSTGASTPGAPASRPKKTVFQMEAEIEAAGIHVPQSLMLASGESMSTSAISLRGTDVPFQSSAVSRAQNELIHYANAAHANVEQEKDIEQQMDQLDAELDALDVAMDEIRDISSQLQSLRGEKDWEVLAQGIRALQQTYPSRGFDKEAVALVHPLFVQAMSDWDASSGDTLPIVAKAFQGIRSVIDPSSRASEQPFADAGRQKRSTPYESLMLLFFNQLHTALLQLQPDHDKSASAFLLVFQEWKSLLPPFIHRRTLREIERRISATLEQWNARKKGLPQWVFSWLPYCAVWSGTLKSKIKTVFQAWSINKGVIPGIQLWRKAFPREIDQLLINIFLPRLAKHLANFEIDPSNQSLDLLNEVLAWTDVLSARVVAELIHVEFFEKKFMPVLHSWLTYENRNLAEISAWLTWWREEVFPKEFAKVQTHETDWNAAYSLVNASLDLESEGKGLETLQLPAVEPVHSPPGTPNFSKSVNKEPARQDVAELTFKDVVESWCADEDLLLMPLRKADEATGFPLFRITASATGKGGVVVYFKGDVIYTQNKKDKNVWDPAGLDANLISKAEG